MSDTQLDLATEGDLHDYLGRPRRRWTGYADQAHAAAAKWGRDYSAFCNANRSGRVIHVVLRPPDGLVPINGLRDAHARLSRQLGDRLRHGRKKHASDFRCDIVAAEVAITQAAAIQLDLHFHLAVRADDRELMAMQTYFNDAGWSWWDSATSCSIPVVKSPAALAHYLGKGLAHAIRRAAKAGINISATDLADLYRQTGGLALSRSTGEFRGWKGEMTRRRLTVTGDQDVPTYVVKSRRPFGGKLGYDCGSPAPQLLRLCVHDFGDGILRPSVLVRGGSKVKFADVAAIYDLNPAILEARHLLGLGSSDHLRRSVRSIPDSDSDEHDGQGERVSPSKRGSCTSKKCNTPIPQGGHSWSGTERQANVELVSAICLPPVVATGLSLSDRASSPTLAPVAALGP